MLTEKPVASYDSDSKTSWLLNAQWAKIRKKFNLEKPLCLLQFFWAAPFEQNLKKNTLVLSLDVTGQLLLVHTFHCCSCTIFPIFSSL